MTVKPKESADLLAAEPADEPPPADRLPVHKRWLWMMAAYHLGTTILTHYHKLIGAAVLAFGLVLFSRPLGRLLGRYLGGAWRKLNAESAAARASEPSDHFDYRPLVVLVTSAVALTLIEYFGHRNTFHALVERYFRELKAHGYYNLMGYAYWSASRVVGYVLLPWLVVLFMPCERIRDYGLSAAGFRGHLWIYGLLFLIVLPPVVMVSFTAPFQHTYPFYKLFFEKRSGKIFL